ncbi:MAG: ABC transporter permease [Chloroflexi bacterium]|nr:ABC transporter permease [Chloroflexota bacterium]
MELAYPRQTAETTITHGLSRPTPPWMTVLATVRKNLQVTRRYLPNLLGNLLQMAVRVAFFLLLSNTISMRGHEMPGMALDGHNLYVFLLGSLVLFVFTRSTLWGPINAVTNDLYNGTLEYLYSNPGSRYAYYVGVVISEVLVSQVVFIPVFALLALVSGVGLGNMVMMLVACVAVLIALTAMGIMIALLALVWRQVNSIAEVLGILFEMLAGAYLPLSAFPQAVQTVSYLLPFTWGYDLVRYYSFQGRWQTILPVWQEWLVVALFAVVFTLASRYLLRRAEQLAKRQGLHLI